MQDLPSDVLGRRDGLLTIAVVEANRVVGEAFAALLSNASGARIRASSVVDVTQLGDCRPDVFVFDAGRMDAHSTRLPTMLRQRVPAAKIIAMDVALAGEDVNALLQVGVNGIVQPDATFNELVTTIRSVAAGNTVIPSTVRFGPQSLYQAPSLRRARGRTTRHPHLTAREGEVIEFILDGLSNKEISARLGVSTFTVKSHVRSIMGKLGLHTRLEIAAHCRGKEWDPLK